MALAPGSRLGVYEITALIGEGGMGQVFRATDTRLKRQVAIKILPPAVAEDHDRLARFQREAEVLASLNHPNIAAIYGLEDSAGVTALVMELVEGEDLSQKLDRPRAMGSGLPIDEVLPIARQIADALEAAHEQGIVHRDLKPANIKVRPDGTVKVLDFGLAKAIEGPGGAGGPGQAGGLENSPTLTSPAMMTAIGMILGTAGYMSPEQARGKAVDKRADIWAFGCVLYEMLSGARTFPGEDVGDTLATVVKTEPDWTLLPAGTPAPIRTLLRRCLRKDPRQRLADAGAVRIEIEDALAAPAINAVGASSPNRRSVVLIAALAGVAIAAAAAIALALLVGVGDRSGAGNSAPLRSEFVVAPPEGKQFSGAVAVSRNGRAIVFRAVDPGLRNPQLYLRALDSPQPRLLPNTVGATGPFWSPDGSSIGFFQGGSLKTLHLTSGTVQTVTAASPSSTIGASWSADGTVLFSGDRLYRVAASGGTPVAVTDLDQARGDIRHASPVFLPDGRRFLFVAVNREIARSATYLGSLDSHTTVLLEPNTFVAGYADGYMLFGRGTSLFARRFDFRSGALTGDPVLLAADALSDESVTRLFIGAGEGVLAYVNYLSGGPATRLDWLGRDGVRRGSFGQPVTVHSLWLAPDESRAFVERPSYASGAPGANIWVVDGVRATISRLTSAAETEGHPVASPDGRSIAYFVGSPAVRSKLMIEDASGLTPAEEVVGTSTYKQVTDWSPDGEFLVFEELDSQSGTGWDLKTVGARGRREVRTILKSRFDERLGQLSPDGRLLAYESNETGRFEVYVVSFPDLAQKWPVSSGGGTQPRWRRDGGELFFIAPDGGLMSAGTSGAFSPTAARRLFDLSPVESDGWTYAVSRNGERFLAMQRTELARQTLLTVLLNWSSSIGRK